MLPIPVLDDEYFGEIAEQARNMIPRLCPQWTDFNSHDPGITFLELFAFLKESQQYHLDQIGPRSDLKYLKLLGMKRRSGQGARTPALIRGAAGRLPRGTRLMADTIPFETLAPLDLTGGHLADGFAWNGGHRWEFYSAEEGEKFRVFGSEPEVGSCCFFRFEGAWTDRLPLMLHFRISGDWPVRRNPRGGEDEPVIPLAGLVWEYLGTDGWTEVRVLEDETCGFLFSGAVRLDTEAAVPVWEEAPEEEKRFLQKPGCWLRVRMAEGAYDVPPMVTSVQDMMAALVQRETLADCLEREPENGAVTADSLLAACGEFELYRRTDGGFWRKLDGVVRERQDFETRFLLPKAEEQETGPVLLLLWREEFQSRRSPGTGDGFPDQNFSLGESGVLPESFGVLVREPEREVYSLWSRVEDFDASGPEDRHYVLDEEAGVLRFGDCIHGQAPEGEILIAGLAVTLGPEGNVKAGRITRVHPEDLSSCGLRPAELQVNNPQDADGGRACETTEACLIRCRRLLRQTDRAVTYEDYERLTRSVPGLMISNCKAVPVDRLPRQDGSLEENCVSIVVEPYSLRREGKLLPAYERNIMNYLDRRRMLGTRISLLSPVYVKITVYAEIISQPHYLDARERITDTVRRFFEKGWTFGEPVQYSELYGIIDTLDCVQRIDSLTIDAQGKGISRGINGDVALPYNGLAVLKQAEFQVRTEE